jgi:5-methylcytosine-specific restriction endonuclease McrA/predicted RNase H-like HicB family nuclease
MMRRTIPVRIFRGESKYVADCLELPVVTEGGTLDETVANIREAVTLHLDSDDLGFCGDPTIAVTMELDARTTERAVIKRKALPKELSIEVFRRDAWICNWCGSPVIFAPVMKYLERFARASGVTAPLAYYHPHWTRTHAPLLDSLGAEIDHVAAHARGGSHDAENFVTSCLKCNSRKKRDRCDGFPHEIAPP